MKILKWLLEDKSDGTYVGVRLSDDSAEKIVKFMKDNDIPDALSKSELHITLIYSRKPLPEFKPRGKLAEEDYISVKPVSFDMFGRDEVKYALVVKLDAPDLISRHEEIMDEHDATYDFDEYIPHLTLSYECAGFDTSKLNIKDIGPLEIAEEYDEELTLPD